MMKSILKIEILISLLVFSGLLIIAFNLNKADTGDAGDSIIHYLQSAHAFQDPSLFFNHWAKPVFILLSSPFAQFGFKGIMVFNIICATLTALFTYYTTKNLGIKNPLIVFVIIFSCPLFFKLIFSGLTEYLFALFLIIGIYYVQKKKYIPALILISFLPLIRSEGLLILGVFGGYILLNKEFKKLPYLLFGQVLYTLAGAIFHKNIFWVITEIPYANLASTYGHGKLTDFIHRLNYVIEDPNYLLFAIGSITLLFSYFRFEKGTFSSVQVFILIASFACIFIAHSIFWWLGIFNSMGLPRVLICVVPIVAIIAAVGLQTITDRFKRPVFKTLMNITIVTLIAIYPFFERPWAVVFNENLFTVEENQFIEERLVPFIKQNYPNYSTTNVYYSHPYLSMALNLDYMDVKKYKSVHRALLDSSVHEKLVIWDELVSAVGEKVSLAQLTAAADLKKVQSFEKQLSGRKMQLVVFEQNSFQKR